MLNPELLYASISCTLHCKILIPQILSILQYMMDTVPQDHFILIIEKNSDLEREQQ